MVDEFQSSWPRMILRLPRQVACLEFGPSPSPPTQVCTTTIFKILYLLNLKRLSTKYLKYFKKTFFLINFVARVQTNDNKRYW
jgi:hypothetical protein